MSPSDERRGPGPPRRQRAAAWGLAVTYLLILGWLIVWKLQAPYVGAHDRPVVTMVPFDDGATSPWEFLGNVLVFVPFGLYLGLLAPSWPWWRAASAAALASALLEGLQWLLAVGIPDLTDVLANVAGATAGLGLLAWARHALGERADAVLVRVLAAGTVLALAAVAAFLASPVHYAPPPDVGPLPMTPMRDA